MHSEIRRLSLDVTDIMDDLTRYITSQYMKKKISDIKEKQSKKRANKGARDEGEGRGRGRGRNLESKENEVYSNMMEANQMMKDFGKIDEFEENFQTLSNLNREKETQLENDNETNHDAI